MATIDAGKKNGKRDSDGYVCWHGVCRDCRQTVSHVSVGNDAGARYAAPMARKAADEHHCT